MSSELLFNSWKTTSDVVVSTPIQIVTAVDTTSRDGSVGTTAIDTGLSITITPRFNTSKVLVTWSVPMQGRYNSQPNAGLRLLLYRNTTKITDAWGTGAGGHGGNAENTTPTHSISYVDSPGTTSAVTYRVYILSYNSSTTYYINRTYSYTGMRSTAFAMEITG
jgi:hypothetical protein